MSTQLAVGYIVRNEVEMLGLTIAKTLPYVDKVFAIDASSTDGTKELLQSIDAVIEDRPWDNDFGGARNACIRLAERHIPDGYLLMLDADEAMLGADLVSLKAAVTDHADKTDYAWAFPRYEFVDDLWHYNPVFYPDYQARCFPLHQGFHYRNKIHEQLYQNDSKHTAYEDGICLPFCYLHIFHYGKCKPLPQVWLKYENYRRFNAKQPLLESVPHDAIIPSTFSNGPRLIFHGARPI